MTDTTLPTPDGHRVVIEFAKGGVSGKLICPESGCETGLICGLCGRTYSDKETAPCYDCRGLTGPTECWIKTWFDNLGAEELLHGRVEVPIRADWDGDTLIAHIESQKEPADA